MKISRWWGCKYLGCFQAEEVLVRLGVPERGQLVGHSSRGSREEVIRDQECVLRG